MHVEFQVLHKRIFPINLALHSDNEIIFISEIFCVVTLWHLMERDTNGYDSIAIRLLKHLRRRFSAKYLEHNKLE